MAEQYAGNPNNYPEDYTIPDDSDPPTAAAVNVGLEALGDRTAWLRAQIDARSFTPTQFTTPGVTEWTAPEYVTRVLIEGCGGGGGGGGGANGGSQQNAYATGGGGGGGAQRHMVVVSVTPGTVYEIVIGAGGAGGAAGDDGEDGGDGEDTIFRERDSGIVLARFKGATGGRGGFRFISANRRGAVPGGAPWSCYRPVSLLFQDDNVTYGQAPILSGPGVGGEGVSSNLATLVGSRPRDGSGSLEGYSGGAGGSSGTGPGVTAPAGGGGGGGGASGYGDGYDGKDGGNGNDSGPGGDAPSSGAGSSAPGIGGGGGGGGGTGTTAGGAGSPGLSGNAGILILRPVG